MRDATGPDYDVAPEEQAKPVDSGEHLPPIYVTIPTADDAALELRTEVDGPPTFISADSFDSTIHELGLANRPIALRQPIHVVAEVRVAGDPPTCARGGPSTVCSSAAAAWLSSKPRKQLEVRWSTEPFMPVYYTSATAMLHDALERGRAGARNTIAEWVGKARAQPDRADITAERLLEAQTALEREQLTFLFKVTEGVKEGQPWTSHDLAGAHAALRSLLGGPRGHTRTVVLYEGYPTLSQRSRGVFVENPILRHLMPLLALSGTKLEIVETSQGELVIASVVKAHVKAVAPHRN